MSVAIADVQPKVTTLTKAGDYIGHVHAKRCDDDASGGHWRVDANGIENCLFKYSFIFVDVEICFNVSVENETYCLLTCFAK